MTAPATAPLTVAPERHDLVVVAPCFGDWPTLPRLLDTLDDATQDWDCVATS